MIVANLFLILLFSYRSSAANVSDRFYPYFHLAPPHGWMNDPNGFCIFKNEFHLFYQYNPVTSQEPGIAHWGHAKSSDLFHWEHLKIAMYPDQSYDRTGVFSGSAIIVDERMHLLYTGNVNHPGENPDHNQRQALAISTNGVDVTKYSDNPVIVAEEHQPNIRDPKVWKNNDTYYMVLGNSFKNNTLGRVLLYSSKDLTLWHEETVLAQSNGELGYMWECPDFFELHGKWVLLFSPQGIKPDGDKYRNLYQTGYIVGDFDYKTLKFTPLTKFRELDSGHDFYATQTLLEEHTNRRILVAWLDMWEQNYPERNDGWTGQMIIPRTLHLSPTHRLMQRPVREALTLRSNLLRTGKATNGTSVKLIDNVGEVKIKSAKHSNLDVSIQAGNATVTISYDFSKGKITLDRGGKDGIRRTDWRPRDDIELQIFIDKSSIEVFCGKGSETFSSRFFPTSEVSVQLGDSSDVEDFTVYTIKRTVPAPQNE